jgi:hypothetical protein
MASSNTRLTSHSHSLGISTSNPFSTCVNSDIHASRIQSGYQIGHRFPVRMTSFTQCSVYRDEIPRAHKVMIVRRRFLHLAFHKSDPIGPLNHNQSTDFPADSLIVSCLSTTCSHTWFFFLVSPALPNVVLPSIIIQVLTKRVQRSTAYNWVWIFSYYYIIFSDSRRICRYLVFEGGLISAHVSIIRLLKRYVKVELMRI